MFLKKLYNCRIIWLAVASYQYNLFLIKNNARNEALEAGILNVFHILSLKF